MGKPDRRKKKQLKKNKNLIMPLKEKILANMKEAMKNREMPRVKALRFVSSAIKNKEIELRPEPLKEDHIVGVLRKQIKQIKESLEHYEKAGYKNQADEEKFQLSVLESYLPQPLSEEELKKMIQQAIKELKAESIKDIGSVIKAVMAQAKGAVEGKRLSLLAREELSKL